MVNRWKVAVLMGGLYEIEKHVSPDPVGYTREQVEALVETAWRLHNEAQGDSAIPKLLWPLLDEVGRALAPFKGVKDE